jgi:hypothetical protein
MNEELVCRADKGQEWKSKRLKKSKIVKPVYDA